MRTLTTENFPTYLRTKMFWRSRLRDVDIFDDVFVHKDQLKQVDLKALEAAKEIAKQKQLSLREFLKIWAIGKKGFY